MEGNNAPSVFGSSRKTLITSTCWVPGNGSPPIPTQSDCPRPTSVVCATASYVSVPERETIPVHREQMESGKRRCAKRCRAQVPRTNLSRLVDVAGLDTHLAPERVDDTGAVRTNKTRLGLRLEGVHDLWAAV